MSSFEEKLTAQGDHHRSGGARGGSLVPAVGGLWTGRPSFYNEKGDVLQVVITGVRGDDRLRLALSPGRLPPQCGVSGGRYPGGQRHSRHHGLLPAASLTAGR